MIDLSKFISNKNMQSNLVVKLFPKNMQSNGSIFKIYKYVNFF